MPWDPPVPVQLTMPGAFSPGHTTTRLGFLPCSSGTLQKHRVTSKPNQVFTQLCCLLAEDLDDLRMEGVTSVVSSGSKFNPARSTHLVEPQAKVTLNICARCAR